MIYLTKRIDELTKILSQGNCTSSDIANYKEQINEMRSIVEWLNYQCVALYQATYETDTKELSFGMKNTTNNHFRLLNFEMKTDSATVIPVAVTNWEPDQTKRISVYCDFNNDIGFKTNRTIQLSIDINSVEYDLFDPEANNNTGNENVNRFITPTEYSKAQSFLAIIRSFYNSVDEYDMKAKARKMEHLIITVYERISLNHELESKMIDFEEVYLPALCKNLDNYLTAINGNPTGSNTKELRSRASESLNLAIISLTKLKDKLYSETAIESSIDLMAIKSMMREKGLI